MNLNVGIWIDHSQAIIVSIENEDETIRRIHSDVAGRVRLSGGSRSRTPYGPQDVASEKKIERRRGHHLRKYYASVLEAVRNASKIYVFGPGEAKNELSKEMNRSRELSSKVVGIESADKMTEGQIAAQVRDFFNTYRAKRSG